jgi:hypothetical protein
MLSTKPIIVMTSTTRNSSDTSMSTFSNCGSVGSEKPEPILPSVSRPSVERPRPHERPMLRPATSSSSGKSTALGQRFFSTVLMTRDSSSAAIDAKPKSAVMLLTELLCSMR